MYPPLIETAVSSKTLYWLLVTCTWVILGPLPPLVVVQELPLETSTLPSAPDDVIPVPPFEAETTPCELTPRPSLDNVSVVADPQQYWIG